MTKMRPDKAARRGGGAWNSGSIRCARAWAACRWSVFLTARSFFEHGMQQAFSEDHVHACFELLVCRRGAGFQFIDGQAHAYGEGAVFVLAPFVTHAHIGGGEPETRYSVRFILPEGQESAKGCDPLVGRALRRVRETGVFPVCRAAAAARAHRQPGRAVHDGGALRASGARRPALGAVFLSGAGDGPDLRRGRAAASRGRQPEPAALSHRRFFQPPHRQQRPHGRAVQPRPPEPEPATTASSGSCTARRSSSA